MQAVVTAQRALVERPWCVIFSIFVKIVLSNPPSPPASLSAMERLVISCKSGYFSDFEKVGFII